MRIIDVQYNHNKFSCFLHCITFRLFWYHATTTNCNFLCVDLTCHQSMHCGYATLYLISGRFEQATVTVVFLVYSEASRAMDTLSSQQFIFFAFCFAGHGVHSHPCHVDELLASSFCSWHRFCLRSFVSDWL